MQGGIIKDTFNNLNETKKEHLVKTLIEQVKRESVKKFNITNYTKKAQIAKGSFYQYFDSKEDAIVTAFSYYFDHKENVYILNDINTFIDDLIEVSFLYSQLKINSDKQIYREAAEQLLNKQLRQKSARLAKELNVKNHDKKIIIIIMQIAIDSMSYNVLTEYQEHINGSNKLKETLIEKLEFLKHLIARLEKND